MKRKPQYVILIVLIAFSACTKNGVTDVDKTVITTTTTDAITDNDDEKDLRAIAVKAFTPCENGNAGDFACKGFDLLARLSIGDFNSQAGNDIWGWTDPQTGKEYVLMGLYDGTAFVDISDPRTPRYLGKLPTATYNSLWRDIKVYQDHAYIVSEAEGHGLQVFDLTKLRGSTKVTNFQADTHLTSFGNAHNIAIDEVSGFAYVLGNRGQNINGGPIIFDLQSPKAPKQVATYVSDNYTHDAHIVVYDGPDSKYSQKQIYVGSNENKLVLLDVTDKANIVKISELTYPQTGYTHQGWFSKDFRYFFLGDELDEIYTGAKTRIVVFDLLNLETPKIHYMYYGPTTATDHNMYVVDDYLYLANYRAGFRLIDISQIDDKKMEEVGFFDSFPHKDTSDMAGNWSIYPFFESRVIPISDMQYGLLLVKQK